MTEPQGAWRPTGSTEPLGHLHEGPSIGFLGPQTMPDTDIRACPRDPRPPRLAAAARISPAIFPAQLVPNGADRNAVSTRSPAPNQPARLAVAARCASRELDFWAERRFAS
ncbi:MAG: hypothetical protein WCB92_20875 [Mycobacterium sp.]